MHEEKSLMQGAAEDESFSELSILVQVPKSELELKYEALFERMSELRSNNRQLKADNTWLRTAKEGLEKQSQTLKQLLRDNKEILKELNVDLRNANSEINRLEDMLHIKQTELSQASQTSNNWMRERDVLNTELINLRANLNAKTSNLQYIEKQCKSLRKSRERQNTKQVEAINSRILSIVNRFTNNHHNINSHNSNKTCNSSTTSPNSKQIDDRYPIQNKTAKICQNNEQSPLIPAALAVKRNREQFSDIVDELEDILRKQTQIIQTQHLQHENVNKKLSISNNTVSILELQLKEAGQLLEQSRTEHIVLLQSINKQRKQYEQSIKQKEVKIEQNQRFLKENEKLLKSIYEGFIHKIITTFSQFLPEEEQMFIKISALIPNPTINSSQASRSTSNSKMTQNKFEIDVLLTELKTAIFNKYIHSCDKVNEGHELRKMNQRLRGMQEEYDLLTIRHQTMQRQYEAILEDNRRILKYNSLSRYRMERNVRGFKRHTSSYPQKIESVSFTSACK